MKNNIVKIKSFDFAVRIIKLSRYLNNEKKEFVLSKQLLRSGTSVGAMIREGEHAQSKLDFIHKLSVAQKEMNETIYWLELLQATELLTEEQFNNISKDAVEIMKLITSIILTTKKNINN